MNLDSVFQMPCFAALSLCRFQGQALQIYLRALISGVFKF